jgi:hypothetical protein
MLDAKEWKLACADEYDSLVNKNIFVLIPRPVGYTDNIAIVADSEEGIRARHDWVCWFFVGAHAFKMNTKTSSNPSD